MIIGLCYYLFKPLSTTPTPAKFTCLDLKEGTFVALDSFPKPKNIYGMGLTYSQHLLETASEFDPAVAPPIFKKDLATICHSNAKVKIPSSKKMIQAVESMNEAIALQLKKNFPSFSPLLDYEVELGFVLLESIDFRDLNRADFVPKLGFFIANDLSARSVALLGEGRVDKHEYWGLSKSFTHFMPMSNQIWVPNAANINAIPCIRIETYVNGTKRQSQTTDNMIFTPKEMLLFIHKKYPNAPLTKGDIVLTGTPGGVAIATPRFLVRLSNLLGFDSFKKLSIKLNGDLSPFLKVGDEVEIRGEGFESVKVQFED
jgi:2-keto-4-pentenoate hydratase/2-oxohepta-3-ene-1,7-dioic acid hydratase in catechol pathway